MATEKNITMKQFNGTDYDTLYPKTIASQIPDVYSKTDTITAETLAQLGLTADKLPNDAFQQIKTLIDNVQSSTNSKARIQTGSYVGTGTYGADNPCSLTFDFEPNFLIILPVGYVYNDSYPGYGLEAGQFPLNFFVGNIYKYYGSYGDVNEYEGIYGKYINNTFYWYCYATNKLLSSGAKIQLNTNGRTYYYYAIG